MKHRKLVRPGVPLNIIVLVISELLQFRFGYRMNFMNQRLFAHIFFCVFNGALKVIR